LHDFGPQVSQILKLYKVVFFQTLAGVFRSILQKDALKHQHFLQKRGTKQGRITMPGPGFEPVVGFHSDKQRSKPVK
jgi:hypothetical protein